jgi:hypothetical protein
LAAPLATINDSPQPLSLFMLVAHPGEHERALLKLMLDYHPEHILISFQRAASDIEAAKPSFI